MGFIYDIFGSILDIIFNGVMSITPVAALGISIIVFTLVTRILLTPLQLSSQRTQRGMSKIQPEMKKIQDKYKNKKDQESQMAQSKEMQALYKKYKINPFAGCLPLLIQLPLIMALFTVLREPAKYITQLGNEYNNIAATVMDKVGNYATLLSDYKQNIEAMTRTTFDLANQTELGQFLSHLNTVQWDEFLQNMGASADIVRPALDLKYSIEGFLSFNVVDTPNVLMATQWWVILVPLLVGASTFIFTKISVSNNSQPTSGEPNSAESMMKTMNVIMPIMTAFFAYTMPIGLAIYWIAGNIIMMAQQFIVNKMLEKKDKELEAQLAIEREEARKNNKITTKKVMKKVPVEKKKEEIKKPQLDNSEEHKPKTYTKKVIKKVPIKKENDSQE